MSYIQDLWINAYPEIKNDVGVMATLYNVGEYGEHGINSSPINGPFGDKAEKYYDYVLTLIQ